MGLMQIKVDLEPYCANCPKMDLETHNLYLTSDLIVKHVCSHRDICENAIWQHEKLKAEDKYYKHESVKVFDKENQNDSRKF